MGKVEYDGVTLKLSLMVLLGLVPAKEAFLGFGHPAVITLLCAFNSKALENRGFINMIGDTFRRNIRENFIFSSSNVVAVFFHPFLNNIGAWPCFTHNYWDSAENGMEPFKFLMPFAFAHLGDEYQIGTPPNIIISEFRKIM
ncbi:MAG: hypothetical protein Ct9H300mP3_10410 [Gammaproteobacteria bacterium]|nr:MAG: hypothetical protein Ct9H300mP3_10410 [Gammaproteobacteria bacterium]